MGEVSHAVLEAEHYKLWRENPLYRMECYLLDLEAERMPASIDFEEHPIIETHTPEPEFVKRQWDIVNQLRGEMRFLSSKVNELRVRKSEQRTNRYNIYT